MRRPFSPVPLPGQRWGTTAVSLAALFLLGFLIARLPLPLAAALVVGGTAVLLTLIQPLVGLGLALVAGPLGALEGNLLGPMLLDSGQILFLFTLFAWIGRGVLRRRLRWPQMPLTLPLLLFIGLMAVTLLDAPSTSFGVKEVAKWAEIMVVMALVVDLARDLPGRRGWPAYKMILLLVLLAALTQAALGIWQFGLRGDGPEHFAIGGGLYRAFGTFQQPNPYGGYMGMSAALGLGALLGWLTWLGQPLWQQGASWAERRAVLWQKLTARRQLLFGLLLLGSTALLAGGLLSSWSRGAWLGFGAALAAIAFFWPRQRRWGLLLLVGGLLCLGLGFQFNLVPASLADRLLSFSQDFQLGDVRGVDINDANYAVLERLAHWQAALDMARDNLWLGVGFGNYEPAYGPYALINWPYPLGHAHNYYLNILAETGLVGTLAYLLLWGLVFYQTISLLTRADWQQRGLALGLLGAWTALSVHHLVDKLYVNNLYIYLGVLFGLLQVLVLDKGDKRLPLAEAQVEQRQDNEVD